MVRILVGNMGSGKTKKMIQMANEDAKNSAGHIIFIDDDNRNMYELDHAVRFINLEEYKIDSVELFYGFICGLVSGNYDIEKIYVDGLDYFSELSSEEMESTLKWFDGIAEKNSVKFIFCFNSDPEKFSEKTKQMML